MDVMYAVPGTLLQLGKTGTHNTQVIRFDIHKWREDYPGGVVKLLHTRSGESEPYEASQTETGTGYFDWTITNADVSVAGYGKCELIMSVGTTNVAKSETFITKTDMSFGAVSPAQGEFLSTGYDVVDNTSSTQPSLEMHETFLPLLPGSTYIIVVCLDTKPSYSSSEATSIETQYHMLNYVGNAWEHIEYTDGETTGWVSVSISGNQLSVLLTANYCKRIRCQILRTLKR